MFWKEQKRIRSKEKRLKNQRIKRIEVLDFMEYFWLIKKFTMYPRSSKVTEKLIKRYCVKLHGNNSISWLVQMPQLFEKNKDDLNQMQRRLNNKKIKLYDFWAER